jgi:NADPH-dependent 2,4-dienoyl-CoA reductase/sulfur reductase-like enzyme
VFGGGSTHHERQGLNNVNSSKYLIIGGGMVAGYAAKELAAGGLKRRELTIISADKALPYERPPLSKGFLSGKDNEAGILINGADWYKDQGIDVKLQTEVSHVDAKNRSVRTTAGGEFQGEHLLLATGARARKLDCLGNELANVFYLRSMQDSEQIRTAAANAKRAVVIGGGFIGMEVASVLAQKNVHTTLIVPEDRVWSRVFTPQMSAFFEGYYKERGVEILTKASVSSLEGKASVNQVALADGRKIPCDIVVAGVGAAPVTEMFAKSGVSIDNGVVVNEYLETNIAGVYAAGDIANYPDKIFEKRRRVEHWDNAVTQGQHWAQTVLGKRAPFVHVPYFFSDVFDLSYELWGDSTAATQIIVRRDERSSSFSVWWLNNARLVAAFTMNRPDEEREVAPKWIETKQNVSAERLGDAAKSVAQAAD